MTLQALRKKIGDEAFFQTLKDYVATFGGGTASTHDFIAIAQRDSGQDLRDFFKQWLYTPGKPTRRTATASRRPRLAGRRHASRRRWR